MADEPKTDVIEVPDATPASAAPAKPTKEDARKLGWSDPEIKSAEEKGLISAEAPKEEPKKEEPKKEEPVEPGKTEPEASKGEPKAKPSSLPDFTMTPEQEKVWNETFGPGTPQKGLYFRMKNERKARQAAEKKSVELEARLKALETKTEPAPAAEYDDDGNAVDPEEKPLTVKMIKQMQQQERERLAQEQRDQNQRVASVQEAQMEQEEFAHSIYGKEPYEKTLDLAKEVITNYQTMFPTKWQQDKVRQLVGYLQQAGAAADQLPVDGYTSAIIGYEIGSMHPDFGKQPDPTGTGTPQSPKANGKPTLTPDAMKRVEKNTQRRGSSAALPSGGGRRTVNINDVTLEDLHRMNYIQRAEFRNKYPERYTALVRG